MTAQPVSAPGAEQHPDPAGAGLRRRAAPAVRRRAATSCWRARRSAQAEIARRRRARLPRRDRATSARATGRSPRRRRPGGPPGRDHRPDRPQDDDQRAELRRQGVAGRPRGRQHPALGQRGRRAAQPARRRSPHASTSRTPDGKAYALRRRDAGHDRACARAAGTCDEKHLLVDGEPVVGALVDFGLYFFHNAQRAARRAAAGPYFYLPKLESHLEARLWNDVFVRAPGRARHPARAPSAPRC